MTVSKHVIILQLAIDDFPCIDVPALSQFKKKKNTTDVYMDAIVICACLFFTVTYKDNKITLQGTQLHNTGHCVTDVPVHVFSPTLLLDLAYHCPVTALLDNVDC